MLHLDTPSNELLKDVRALLVKRGTSLAASALAAAMGRLSDLAQDQFGLTLAKPYSPTSKGSIEGLFNILEQIFKGLPGWIGGRRDNKKTANKGQTVAPYRR